MKKIYVTKYLISNTLIKYHDINYQYHKIPNLFKIIFGNNKYLLEYSLKKENKFKYWLIRNLGKRWSYYDECNRFINYIQNNKLSYIFISPPHYVIDEIMSFYYPNMDNIKFIKLPLNANSKKVKKIANYLRNKIAKKYININEKLKIICCNLSSDDFIDIFTSLFSKENIYVRYYDMIGMENIAISNNFNPSKYFTLNNIETYSKYDATKYLLRLKHNYVNKNILNIISYNTKEENIISFIGSINKIRLDYLIQVIQLFNSKEISFIFYLPNIDNNSLQKLKNQSNFNNIYIYKEYLSYEKGILLAAKSIAVIDLYRLKEDEGYSYRIAEGIGLYKKIISNRSCLLMEKFYNENIFILNNETKPTDAYAFIKANKIDYKNVEDLFREKII